MSQGTTPGGGGPDGPVTRGYTDRPTAEKSPPGGNRTLTRGNRVPSFRSLPAVSGPSEGPAIVALAAEAGLVLDPWESDVLNDASGRVDGRWSASKVGLIVPRQNGKGAVLTARMLAGLFLFGERLQIATSHEVKSNLETFSRLVSYIEDTPKLMAQVKAIGRRNGQEQIEMLGGARVRFMARSRKSGRSFSADAIYLDEAFELSPEDVAALIPTASAGADPQIWFASTAPDAHSEVLRQVQTAGRDGSDPSLAYAEWCAADDAEPDDPTAIAAANPSLGIRLDLRWILETERGILSEVDFLRERLGVSRANAAGETVIDMDRWADCEDPTSQPVGPLVLAVDIAPKSRDAAIVIAGLRRDGRLHVELVDARPGADWVVARTADLVAKHDDIAQVAVDERTPVRSLPGNLAAAGVDEEKITLVDTDGMIDACDRFYTAVVDGQLRHLPNLDLDDALRAASQRDLGDAWAWSRRKSAGTIAPLVAATLATWTVVQEPEVELTPFFV